MQEGISKDTNYKNKIVSTLKVFPALMVFQDAVFKLFRYHQGFNLFRYR